MTQKATWKKTQKKFYDVRDVEIIENTSSDYDDAEESESIHSFHGANRIEIKI